MRSVVIDAESQLSFLHDLAAGVGAESQQGFAIDADSKRIDMRIKIYKLDDARMLAAENMVVVVVEAGRQTFIGARQDCLDAVTGQEGRVADRKMLHFGRRVRWHWPNVTLTDSQCVR